MGCFSIAVGRSATADGSVLFGHNEDDDGKLVTRLHVVPRQSHSPGEVVVFADTGARIPQVEGENWRYLRCEVPGYSNADVFLNEWGVAIASNACDSKEVQPYDLTSGGVYYGISWMIAERARTAREAIHLVGEMVRDLGYASSGRTYVIADPKEVWLCSLVAGRQWVARRVPDGEAALLPNRYTIREIDLEDTENFSGSPGLISYAADRGWYDPDRGEPFDFARAYGNLSVQTGERNTLRQWMAILLVAGKEYPLDDLPFSVKPLRQLTLTDVIRVLRSHYEGTAFDQTAAGDPHHGALRVICTATTQESFVMQLRSGLPREIGNVYWRAQGRPCQSAYIPWYSGIERVPRPYGSGEPSLFDESLEARHYDPNSAHWVFNRMDALVDRAYGTRGPLVRKEWDEFEGFELLVQPRIEETALTILEAEGCPSEERHCRMRSFLTYYTESLALSACHRALEWIDRFDK
jgi:dipeptidase